MSDLTELLERVKAATGPDKVLDRDILCIIDGWTYEKRGRDRQPWMYGAKGERRDPPGVGIFGAARPTSSIDAAVALVERKLPGCGYIIGMGRETPDEPLGACAIYSSLSGEGAELAEEEAPTLPLAVLTALLSALIAQGASS